MLFFSRTWGDPDWVAPFRAAQSLGLFAGHPADCCQSGSDFFAELPSPRARPRAGWRVARAPGGSAVLLHGWIDNIDDLARELGFQGSAEALYGAAVERWGENADRHVIGEYASLVVLPDQTLRMARSPWCSFPLFFHLSQHGVIACSIPRPMFAAGLPKVLRRAAIEQILAFEMPDGEHSQFEGIEQVPGGRVLTFTRDGWRSHDYYDPLAIAPVRFKRDEDYVEAANAMLAEATRAALRLTRSPAVTLSGGLDSPILCDEILRQLPEGQRLRTITFVPHPDWQGDHVPALFANDRPYVEQFIARHSRIDPIFVDNRDVDFLSDTDGLMLAGDAGYTSQVLGMVHTGVWRAARDAGSDWVLSAGMGNLTFSNEAPWAPAEFFRRLRWGEVWRLASTRIADPRPMWRRLIGTAVMPNLPASLRWKIRDLISSRGGEDLVTNAYIDANGPLAEKRQWRNARDNISDLDFFHSRERFVRKLYDLWWRGGEAGVAVHQFYGLMGRDVLSYRPFIELCLAMPTDQFVRRGERRWLARRMGIGRLPEAQRTEPRHGDHLADWHVRMTANLPMLREEVQRIADHPEMGAAIDTEAMLRDIDAWPGSPPTDIASVTRLRVTLPSMIYARRYFDYVSGRNPQ